MLYSLSVLLGLQFGGDPLSRVNAHPGPLDMLTVDLPAEMTTIAASPLHPVVRAVISNIQQLLHKGIGRFFLCACVLVAELRELRQPPENS